MIGDELRNIQTKKGHEKSEQILIATLIEYERKLENLCPPLIKVSVTRSGIAQRGKHLYKVNFKVIKIHFHNFLLI